MMDIFRRKAVGWMLAAVESARLAEQWIRDLVAAAGIVEGSLTIHADRGTAMRSKTVAELFDDCDIAPGRRRAWASGPAHPQASNPGGQACSGLVVSGQLRLVARGPSG